MPASDQRYSMPELIQLTNEAYEINCYINYNFNKAEQYLRADLQNYMRMFEDYTYFNIIFGAENKLQDIYKNIVIVRAVNGLGKPKQ